MNCVHKTTASPVNKRGPMCRVRTITQFNLRVARRDPPHFRRVQMPYSIRVPAFLLTALLVTVLFVPDTVATTALPFAVSAAV